MTETSNRRLPTMTTEGEIGEIKGSSKSTSSSVSFDQGLSAPGLMEGGCPGDETGDHYVDLNDMGGAPTIARR